MTRLNEKDIDPRTGLPKLPEHMRWRVTQRFLGPYKLRLEERWKAGGRWWNVLTVDIPSGGFGLNLAPAELQILATAKVMVNKHNVYEAQRHALRNNVGRRRKVIGPYPPNTLRNDK